MVFNLIRCCVRDELISSHAVTLIEAHWTPTDTHGVQANVQGRRLNVAVIVKVQRERTLRVDVLQVPTERTTFELLPQSMTGRDVPKVEGWKNKKKD